MVPMLLGNTPRGSAGLCTNVIVLHQPRGNSDEEDGEEDDDEDDEEDAEEEKESSASTKHQHRQ